MKLNRILLTVGAAFALAALAISCNSTKTTTYYAADGKTITKTEEESTESAARHKDFAIGGSVTAVKVETTGSTSSGTMLPNFIIGGGATGTASSAVESSRPVVNYSYSAGVLTSLTNSSATSGTINYIGTPGETASETALRLAALKAMISTSASTDSASTSEDTTTDTAASMKLSLRSSDSRCAETAWVRAFSAAALQEASEAREQKESTPELEAFRNRIKAMDSAELYKLSNQIKQTGTPDQKRILGKEFHYRVVLAGASSR